jgi:hypothetical protein
MGVEIGTSEGKGSLKRPKRLKGRDHYKDLNVRREGITIKT